MVKTLDRSQLTKNFKRVSSFCTLIMCIVLVITPSVVAALSPDQKKLFNENINYFDINSCAAGSDTSTSSDSTSTGSPSSSTTMYDSADPSRIPSDAKVVASYVGNQQGYKIAKQKFPDASLVSINETPGNNDPADIWGIEPGSGKTVQSTADAIDKGTTRGVYGVQTDLDAVKKILDSKKVPRSSYVLWLSGAGTQGDPSIPNGDDAHQYKYVPDQYDVNTISSTFLSTLQGSNDTAPTAPTSDGAGNCCDTSSPSVPVTNGTPSTLIGDNNVAKSFNYFIQAGFTPAQSAGIVGNLMQESGGGTTVDPGASNGIAGFLVGELSMDSMRKWVESQDEDPASLKGQLDFLLWYITKSQPSIGKDIKATKTVEAATITFQNEFEKCGGTCLQDSRIKYANEVADGKFGGGSVSPDGGNSVDISDIVKKYNLQSAIIQRLGNGKNIIAAENASKPPVTPASTMKLIIADTALQSGLDLGKTVTVGSDVYYDGRNDLGSSRLTLREAMQQMLSKSSNVGANVLMKAMGGPDAFTNKAQGSGYTHTDVKAYYDPSNDGKNSSTIGDQAAAMNHIFSRDGSDYQVAQDALKQAAQSDNYYSVNDIANKWAGTTQVAGNVGLFNINGHQYIIGLYYNGDSSSQAAKNAIKNGSADLASLVSSSDPSASSGKCCPASTSTDTTTLSGNSNEEKVFNFFVSTMGYTPQQAAGAVGSLDFESGGMNPTISNGSGSGAYGIAQWLGSRYTNLKNFAGSKYNTLDGQVSFMQHELKTGYASINSQMKGASSYQDAQQIWTWYYEGLKDYPDQWHFDERNNYAQEALQKYGGNGGAGGGTATDGSSDASCADGSASSSDTVQKAVEAAKKLSSYHAPYVLGGLHGANELKITDPNELRQKGLDCSSSVTWVLHQAGIFDATAVVSGALESWGKSGKGQEITVWANSYHTFLEFNVPGVGHYQLNTVNSGGDGAGPRWEPWSYSNRDAGAEAAASGGYTPRHWQGT